MTEITYSEFQTLIEKQSGTTYRILRNDISNPSYSAVLQQICNIMYDKSVPVTFAVDNTSRPTMIHICICYNNNPISEDWKIIYKENA